MQCSKKIHHFPPHFKGEKYTVAQNVSKVEVLPHMSEGAPCVCCNNVLQFNLPLMFITVFHDPAVNNRAHRAVISPA